MRTYAPGGPYSSTTLFQDMTVESTRALANCNDVLQYPRWLYLLLCCYSVTVINFNVHLLLV